MAESGNWLFWGKISIAKRMSKTQESSENPYFRFDTFKKIILLLDEFGLLSFYLKQLGYILISYERLPSELHSQFGKYIADALFKAKVKCANGTIIEVCVHLEFQHTNDPDMLERVQHYRLAIKKIHKVNLVIPITIYTGVQGCTMVLKEDDSPIDYTKSDFPLVDLTQLPPEIFINDPAAVAQIIAILNHQFEPAVLAHVVFEGLRRIEIENSYSDMEMVYTRTLELSTKHNIKAMSIIKELMKIYPDIVLDDTDGMKEHYRLLYELKLKEDKQMSEEKGKSEGIEIGKSEGIEIGKSEGIEIGKSEGIVEGRIESAYLMMKNGGISFDGASAILGLSKIEQAMLRQRMAKNGH
jgi:hypothetical protein